MKWTIEEENNAIELLNKGLTYKQIAEVLNRSWKSVKEKMTDKNLKQSDYKIDKKVLGNCLNCNDEIVSDPSYIRKFCNSSCAATFNNKIFKRKYPIEKEYNHCKFCNKDLVYKTGDRSKKYCGVKCQQNYLLDQRVKKLQQDQLIGCPPTIKKCVIKRDGHQCSECKNTEWMGKPIPLVLDHIDGNSQNNKNNNLRLVCGNCDMQLPTYKSKNKGNGRAFRRKRYQEGKSY